MLVQSCLTKDRRERASDIAAARYALRQATTTTSSTSGLAGPAPAPRRSREIRYAAAIAVLLAGVVGLSGLLVREAGSGADLVKPVARLSFVPPADVPFRQSGVDRDFVITPDGSRILYRARTGLLAMRVLDSGEVRVIPGTENARAPFISADGQWIGYWTLGTIRKVPLAGGPSVAITQSSSPPRGHAWGPDNTIFFGTNVGEGLRRVSAGGGESEVLTTLAPGEQGHTFPSILPDGRTVLFTVFAGGVERTQIAALDLQTRERRIVVADGGQPLYIEPGYLVYRVGNSVRAVRFDLQNVTVVGAPVTVMENVAATQTGGFNFDVAKNGTLVYLAGAAQGVDRVMAWADRTGHFSPIDLPARTFVFARLSPDGSRIVVDSRDQEQDVWVAATARGRLTRLSFGPSLDAYAVWMPDSRSVLYASSRDGALAVFRQATDGTGEPQRLISGPDGEGVPVAVAPDGKFAILRRGAHLSVMSLDGSQRTVPMLAVSSTTVEHNADISPNGRWITFDSAEAGKSDIYVRPFPNVNDGRWQISTGGAKPAWSRNGKELFFEDGAGGLVAVPVETGTTFVAGVPRKLFESRISFAGTTTGRTWDVAADGRFLMIRDPVDDIVSPPLNVVLNWIEELKAKLPVPPR